MGTLQKKALYNFPNLKKRITFASGFADMAQLVEQRIRNAWVRGSSPLIGSNYTKKSAFGTLFRFNDNLLFLGCRGFLIRCCSLLLSTFSNRGRVVFNSLWHKFL